MYQMQMSETPKLNQFSLRENSGEGEQASVDMLASPPESQMPKTHLVLDLPALKAAAASAASAAFCTGLFLLPTLGVLHGLPVALGSGLLAGGVASWLSLRSGAFSFCSVLDEAPAPDVQQEFPDTSDLAEFLAMPGLETSAVSNTGSLSLRATPDLLPFTPLLQQLCLDGQQGRYLFNAPDPEAEQLLMSAAAELITTLRGKAAESGSFSVELDQCHMSIFVWLHCLGTAPEPSHFAEFYEVQYGRLETIRLMLSPASCQLLADVLTIGLARYENGLRGPDEYRLQ